MLLKFTASKIDELEKSTKKSLQQLVAEGTIGSMTSFIEKGLVNENGTIGCSRNVALSTIDDYLENEENDLDTLRLDIMGALVDGGFLSRQLDVKKIKQTAMEKIEQIKQDI